jgi:hypothetical protein
MIVIPFIVQLGKSEGNRSRCVHKSNECTVMHDYDLEVYIQYSIQFEEAQAKYSHAL